MKGLPSFCRRPPWLGLGRTAADATAIEGEGSNLGWELVFMVRVYGVDVWNFNLHLNGPTFHSAQNEGVLGLLYMDSEQIQLNESKLIVLLIK